MPERRVGSVSLAELQAVLEGEDGGIANNALRIADAMPALLEIAKAALALEPELVYMVGTRSEALREALAGVRR